MKNTGKKILFGFLLWLTVFAASFIIFPFKDSNPPLFETLISIILSASTVMYGNIYFKNTTITLKTCVTVGLIWAAVNILIDLPLFSYGPMKKPLPDYFTDIGLTYLMIPIILSAFALRRGENNPGSVK
jgi:hypothetical protein